ncbi:hypothetical protein PGN35_023735 [Nodosilinea sp. PGN35]|uniref:hypothetical protein n=1 Tax=Nodosilinea sp. PGN35 TaxID=3020489 RepID=UPI0023B2BA84|nr:hypothetical protein [Nodosilinea sp. TSF1-S3]MDF0370025.1 hypothetical protein [Nodosilinea sp. TSF1-S3]
MELVILIICVAASWAIAHLVDSLPDLGRLLVPSPWLLGGLALIITTWLMRD